MGVFRRGIYIGHQLQFYPQASDPSGVPLFKKSKEFQCITVYRRNYLKITLMKLNFLKSYEIFYILAKFHQVKKYKETNSKVE